MPVLAADRLGSPPNVFGAVRNGAAAAVPISDARAPPPPIGEVAELYGSDVTVGGGAVLDGPPKLASEVSEPNIGTGVSSVEIWPCPREEDAGGWRLVSVPR